MTKNEKHIPYGAWPRGLSRRQAAAYISVSASFFDTLVAGGMFPKPIKMGKRSVWDRADLDRYFDNFAGVGHRDPMAQRLDQMIDEN